jgi:LCP family protein required for cell wall assembly
VLVISLSIIAALIAGAAIGVQVLQSRLNSNIERIGDPFAALPSRPAVPTPSASASSAPADTKAVNILMVGSDSRISAGDPNQWTYGGQRTDAIMLVHIPADRSGAYLFSIPRDSWVDIPGHGTAKINAAFSWGGPALLIQTVEQLTNVRIDHLAITDFDSFKALTDELGGVEITAPKDVYDNGTLVSQAGTHLLTGDQALMYVRERHGLARGDFDRVQRQQNWMRAIMLKAQSQGTLTSPTALLSLLTTVTKSVAVDNGFTFDEMKSLALSLRSVRSANVSFRTVPVTGTGTSTDGQSIVVLNRAAFDPLMVAVAHDTVGAYLTANPKTGDTLTTVVS